MKFLSRFQRLERPRRPEEQASHGNAERFRVIEPMASIPDPGSGDLARFAPAVEPALELQPRSDAQPFVRCPSCGLDSPPGTRRCSCGTALDTLEAVAFNTTLWDSHRQEVVRHEAEQTRSRVQQLEEARQHQEEYRLMGEAIAREIAEQEGVGRRSDRPLQAVGVVLLVGVLAAGLLPEGPWGRAVLACLLGGICVWTLIAVLRGHGRD